MSDIIVGPQVGNGFVIKELWAVVVMHGDGDEAVPAVLGPSGTWLPLIAADPKRLIWLRDQAGKLANATSRPLKLVRFDTRTDLETFGGSR